MGITKKFVNMCSVAEALQLSWNPCIGDFYMTDYSGTTGFPEYVEKEIWGTDEEVWKRIHVINFKSDIEGYYHTNDKVTGAPIVMKFTEEFKKRTTWLPRIDQMLVLLGYEFKEFINFSFQMLNYGEEDYFKQFSSGEEVLLACLMRQKYDMIWKDEKWSNTSDALHKEKEEMLFGYNILRSEGLMLVDIKENGLGGAEFINNDACTENDVELTNGQIIARYLTGSKKNKLFENEIESRIRAINK